MSGTCWCGHIEDDHVVIFGAQHCMECDPNMRKGGPVQGNASLFDVSSYVGASFIAAGHDFGGRPRPTPDGYYYGPKGEAWFSQPHSEQERGA